MPVKPNGNSIEHFRNKLEKRRQERAHFLNSNLTSRPKKENLTSDNVKSEIEKSLLKHLNDPLVDLPISSEDILFKLNLNFREHDINKESVNKYLFKFSTTYKFIK